MTTTFHLETVHGTESLITVTGEFLEGSPAACDGYGRPTECDTDDEWEILEIEVDGVSVEISDAVASEFIAMGGKMSARDFEAYCIEMLNYERDFGGCALPF